MRYVPVHRRTNGAAASSWLQCHAHYIGAVARLWPELTVGLSGVLCHIGALLLGVGATAGYCIFGLTGLAHTAAMPPVRPIACALSQNRPVLFCAVL